MRITLCAILASTLLVVILGSSAVAQTATADANTPFSGNTRIAPDGGFTVSQWITNARRAHNEWNNNAFNPSGSLSPTSRPADFISNVYATLLQSIFSAFNSFLTKITALFNLANIFGGGTTV
jgi:hypothetical protein